MIQVLFQTIINYANALLAGFIKTAQDGRKVVYPWGFLFRGYVIASEEDEWRMKRKFAVFLIVVPILIGVGHAFWGYPGSLAVAALIVVCYAIYVTRLTANMEPSGEGLSLTEEYRAQARKQSPAQLWSWVATGIFCACLGVLESVLTPEKSTESAFLIGIGVFSVGVGGYFLSLRRGASPPAAEPSSVGESVAAEAPAYFGRSVGPVRIWFMTIAGLVFTGLGIFVFVIDPADRSGSAGFIAVFGLVAAFGIALLVLRYRERHG